MKVSTPKGTISAQKCLIAVNAYGGTLEPVSAAHIMPIGSFIGATVPWGRTRRCCQAARRSTIPASSCAISADRRDGRLLFGGREVYGVNDPKDIHIHIRRQITELYPALRDVEITHGWGGYVGITVPRKPFVREVMPNVISAGGYSGHGVMLSNFFGKLYAETVAGNRDRLKLIEDLKIPPFPGGRRFRTPLLFLALNWFALRDRIYLVRVGPAKTECRCSTSEPSCRAWITLISCNIVVIFVAVTAHCGIPGKGAESLGKAY